MAGNFRKQVDEEAKRLARQKMAKYFAYSRQQQVGTTFSGVVDPHTKKITAPNGQQYDGIPLGNVSQRIDDAVVVNSSQAVYIDESTRYNKPQSRSKGLFLYADPSALYVRGRDRSERYMIPPTLYPHPSFFGGSPTTRGFSWAGVLDDCIVLVYWDKWKSRESPTIAPTVTGSRAVYIVQLQKVRATSRLRIGNVSSVVVPWTQEFFDVTRTEYESPGVQKLNYNLPYGPVTHVPDSWGNWSTYPFGVDVVIDGLVMSTATSWGYSNGLQDLVESMLPSLVLYRGSDGSVALGALVSYHRLFTLKSNSYFTSIETENGFNDFRGFNRTSKVSLAFSGLSSTGAPLYSGTYERSPRTWNFTSQTYTQIRQTIENSEGFEIPLSDLQTYAQMPDRVEVESDAGVFLVANLFNAATLNSASTRVISDKGLRMQVLESMHFPNQGGIAQQSYTSFAAPQVAFNSESRQLFGSFARFVQTYEVDPPKPVDSSSVNSFGGQEKVDHYSISAPAIEMTNFGVVSFDCTPYDVVSLSTIPFDDPPEYQAVRLSYYSEKSELQNFDISLGQSTALGGNLNTIGSVLPIVFSPLHFAANAPGTPIEDAAYTAMEGITIGPNFVGNPQFVFDGFSFNRKIVKSVSYREVQSVSSDASSIIKIDLDKNVETRIKDKKLMQSLNSGLHLIDFSI